MWTGIDIGHSYIKIVQVIHSWNGFRLVGIARLQNVLPSQTAEDVSKMKHFFRMQLQRIFSENNLKPSECVIGVTGKDINLRIIQMPPIQSPARFQKMMGYELMQIAGKTGENLYSDYCRLNLTNKNYPEIPILIGMAKTTFIDDEIKRLTKLGLNIKDICPNAIALSYALRESEIIKPTETVLLADFGMVNTEIVIHQGRNLIFARNISAGGKDLTDAIQSKLNISQGEAEALKITQGKISPREVEISKESQLLDEALRSGVGQFQSSIESAISFALAQLKIDGLSPDRILISGGSAKLKGLAGYLGDIMAKPVAVFEPFKNIRLNSVSLETRNKISESACDFSIALGLALSGAAHNKNAHISFLPPSLKKKRAFYQSALPLITSGILIIIVMIVWIISAYSFRVKETANIKQLKSERDRFANIITRFNGLQDRKKTIEENYRKLNKIPQTTDFLYRMIKLISQYLPSEAWVSQVTLMSSPRDSRTMPKGSEPEDSKEIIIAGYLEDDNPYTLEKLRSFVVDELNQNNNYLLLEASLKKLDTPKVVTPRGKKEFEIAIKIKDKITTAK